jgi:putative transposase
MALPDGPNQRWSLDFVADTLAWGRRLRILAIVDDFTREALALVVDTSIGGQRMARELDALIVQRGKPLTIVSDNVLRSEEWRLAGRQVSDREHELAAG